MEANKKETSIVPSCIAMASFYLIIFIAFAVAFHYSCVWVSGTECSTTFLTKSPLNYIEFVAFILIFKIPGLIALQYNKFLSFCIDIIAYVIAGFIWSFSAINHEIWIGLKGLFVLIVGACIVAIVTFIVFWFFSTILKKFKQE